MNDLGGGEVVVVAYKEGEIIRFRRVSGGEESKPFPFFSQGIRVPTGIGVQTKLGQL